MLDDSWLEIADLEHLVDKLPHEFVHENERYIITREENRWCAYTLRCPHKGAQMRLIDYSDGVLACPLHGWCFDLKDNGCETHGYTDLLSHDVTVQENKLYIKID